ncbi:MAG: hypothetical protein MUF64_00190 [Polyangiaceae bacterium]|nr:hypothetical protein [Polyangiaceae bacterium]
MTTSTDPIERPRPRGLLLTSVLCIMVGWAGVLGGYREISFYRAEYLPEPPMSLTVDAREQELAAEYFRSERQVRDRAREVRLPLAVANLLLSGLLVFAASRSFAGRSSARSLALQALGANGLLAVVDYALSRGMRGELVPVVARFMQASMKSTPGLPEHEMNQLFFSAIWAGFRLQLALLLVIYGLAWWALSTAQARAFFDAEPRDEDG